MQKQKGFTLIELIVVIAIIGILATIVTTSVTKYIKRSKIARFRADVRQVQTAAAQYFIDNGGYPLGVTDVVDTPSPFPNYNYNSSYLGSDYYYLWYDYNGNNDGGCYYFVATTESWSSMMYKNIVCSTCLDMCNDGSYEDSF